MPVEKSNLSSLTRVAVNILPLKYHNKCLLHFVHPDRAALQVRATAEDLWPPGLLVGVKKIPLLLSSDVQSSS
jgi:hypothetical protein